MIFVVYLIEEVCVWELMILWVIYDQWRKNWKFKYKLLFLTPEAAVEDKVQVKWKIQSGDSKLSLRRSHLELLRGNGLDPALLFVRISYSPQDRGPCHILYHNPCWLHDQDPSDKFISPWHSSEQVPCPMLHHPPCWIHDQVPCYATGLGLCSSRPR